MAVYVDTSAAVKLVVEEAESAALRRWREDAPPFVSSDLLVTELHRAAARVSAAAIEVAIKLLESIELVPIARSRYLEAGLVTPTDVRSLDSLHLVSAIGLGASCSGVLTYDTRLAAATRVNGLEVHAPA